MSPEQESTIRRSKAPPSARGRSSIPRHYLGPDFELTAAEWERHAAQYHRKWCPYFIGVVTTIHKQWVMLAPRHPRHVPQPAPEEDVTAFISGRYLLGQRKANHFVAVGDEVICPYSRHQPIPTAPSWPLDKKGTYAIIHRKPRTNVLYRQDPFYKTRQHVLGANIDQMVVVSSFVHPSISWQLLDHYLVYAELYQLPALLVITKSDLLTGEGDHCDDLNLADILDRLMIYESLGYPLYILELLTGGSSWADELTLSRHDQRKFISKHAADAARLAAAMAQQTSLLSGLSGVGKSSLVNHLGGASYRKVGMSYRFGAHTTSSSQLIKLTGGGLVMDTPGLKSFPINDTYKDDLSWCYRDFQPYLGQCRFASCRHLHEPGCAIKAACEQGKITPWRYDSYRRLLSSWLNS